METPGTRQEIKQRAHCRFTAILAHLNNHREVLAEKLDNLWVKEFEKTGLMFQATLNTSLTQDELVHLNFCFHIVRFDDVSKMLVYYE